MSACTRCNYGVKKSAETLLEEPSNEGSYSDI